MITTSEILLAREVENMLSIAILDDDMRVLEEYERSIPLWIRRNNIQGKIITATTDYKQFIREIRDQQANVCILDVNLRTDVNGITIARLIRKENIRIEIIFCTGFLEYMPQAFDVQAYNFVPKSNNAQLEHCLVKLANDIIRREAGIKTLEIKYGSRVYYVPHSEIVYIQRIGTKTIVNCTNKVLEIYESLEFIAEKLNNPRFRQCHRSTIVNIEFIDFVDTKQKYISLRNGSKCELGPKYYEMFKSKIEWSDVCAV
jgi:DNA-binding LytR/AlgR family response regulator